MLRHGVKVVPILLLNIFPERETLRSELSYSMSLDIQEELYCLHSTPSTTPKILNSSYPATSKEQVIVSNVASSSFPNSYPDSNFLSEKEY